MSGIRLVFTLNGERCETEGVWPGESLLHVLRERVSAPGSKNACEQGECGSCSIYLDDVLACACLVAAGQAHGRDVRTVEGLGTFDADGEEALHPVQQAFIDAGAVQCGYCTPGLIVAIDDLLNRNPAPTVPEVREALAGNLCRCTGYEKILDAVAIAAARQRGDVDHVIEPKVVPVSSPPPVGGIAGAAGETPPGDDFGFRPV